MSTNKTSLSVARSIFDGLELIYAQNHQDKQAIYDLRFNCEKLRFQELRNPSQVIDEKDNRADHLYLRSIASKEVVASIRIFQYNNRRSQLPPIYQSDLLIFGEPLINYTAEDFSEADKIYTNPQSTIAPSELRQMTYLAAIAFARLRFHKFLLSKMTCENFKALRTQGVLFEQTSYALLDNDTNAYFYCSTDDGVSLHTETWDLYQHFLDKLAPQLNQPDIVSHNSGSSYQSLG